MKKMKGFTLIEVLVSVAIFAVVMVIALGALLTISDSDRKAESLKAVINNLNFAVDSMSRSIRTGTVYHCGSTGTATQPQDCSAPGANYFTFLASNGIQVYYRLDSTNAGLCNQTAPNIGCIEKSTNGGSTWLPLTAPEVVITDFSGASPASYLFYVTGSAPGPDTVQPKVNITLSGYVRVAGGATSQAQCGTPGYQCSVFHLQTTVTQRIYDR